MPLIRLETMIDAPPERCFDLAIDVDVHVASVAASGERAVAGVTAGRMALGDWVTWEARHFGVRQRLTAVITEYDRPHAFVDEMRAGIFERFRHFPGYRLAQEIHRSERSRVYRAVREADQLPVVVKTINKDFPDPLDLARLRREEVGSRAVLRSALALHPAIAKAVITLPLEAREARAQPPAGPLLSTSSTASRRCWLR